MAYCKKAHNFHMDSHTCTKFSGNVGQEPKDSLLTVGTTGKLGHVTLIQEISGQWAVSLSINHLHPRRTLLRRHEVSLWIKSESEKVPLVSQCHTATHGSAHTLCSSA